VTDRAGVSLHKWPKSGIPCLAPAGVDTEKPSAARIHDWHLGGAVARQNRAWMNRVVEAALDAGMRQYIGLGSGVPTVGNVHDIIRRRLPENEGATEFRRFVEA
jgi:hypothetical protein